MNAAITILLSLAIAQPAATDPTRVIEQLFDAYRALDADRLVAVMAPGITFEDPTTRLRANGTAEMRKMAESIRATYRAMTIDVHSLIVSGEHVAAEVTIGGTAIKPDGTTRQIRVRGASFFRVRGGLIETWTDYFDAVTLIEQMK
jgi:steroid delta-isomerase-like uncharacterized protein